MADAAKLEATMTHIIDHPEEWNQAHWVCGSAACYAGRTLLNEGYEVRWGETFAWAVPAGVSFCFDDEEEYIEAYQLHGLQAERVPVSHKAAQFLEISTEDAEVLFSSDCKLDNLEGMVKDLINGEALRDHWKYVRGGYRWERIEEENKA